MPLNFSFLLPFLRAALQWLKSEKAQLLGACLGLALPALWGLTLGPSSNMLPLIFGLACTGLFIFCSPWARPSAGLLRGMGACVGFLLLRSALEPLLWMQQVWAAALALALWLGVVAATQAWEKKGRTSALLAAVLAAAVLSSVIGVCQFFHWAQNLTPWIHPGYPPRVFANLRQPNQLATLVSMGLAVLVFVPKPQLNAQRAGARVCGFAGVLLLGLLAFANAASLSRTGLVQWGALWVLTAAWALGQRRWTPSLSRASLALALYALFTLLLAHGVLTEHGLSWQALGSHKGNTMASALARFGEADGNESRSVLWANVAQVIAQRPWLGWGWGGLDYGMLQTPLRGAIFPIPLDNAHNLPLQLAAELGLPFALVFCGLFAFWAWRRRPWAESVPERQAAWGMLLALGLHSMLEYPLWYAPFLLASAVAVGLLPRVASKLGAMDGGTVESGSMPCQTRARAWMLGVGAGVMLLSVYWAYAWCSVSQVYLDPADRMPSLTQGSDWEEESLNTYWFAQYAEFARMSLIELTPETAQAELARTQRVMHYSTDSLVLHRARDAAQMLGEPALAAHYQAQLRARWHEQ